MLTNPLRPRPLQLATIGVVHRDLAARNVLVDSSLTLCVSDFGLARNMKAKPDGGGAGTGDDGDEYYRTTRQHSQRRCTFGSSVFPCGWDLAGVVLGCSTRV